MATEVLMPQMGESIAEGTITRWLAAVGDAVTRDQPLLEISTDKVDAEIPSPGDGVLLEIRRQEGETVPVNEIVGMVGEAGEQPAAAAPSSEAPAPAEAEVAAAPSAVADAPSGPLELEERVRRFSSPLVRSIAAKEGVDISTIEGSGVHGRVTKKDILSHLETAKVAPAAASAAPETAPVAAPATPAPAVPVAVAQTPATAPASRPAGGFSVAAYAPSENVVIEPMSRIRSITAAHMTYSKATSAHVTTVFEVDMTPIAKLRARAKDAFFRENGTKLTYMPFIFRAVANALKQFPQLNASIDGSNVVFKKDVNLGMAVAMDRGLIVPVLHRADDLSLIGLARTANDLAERARAKKLKPEEAQGGTFTITNPGVFGSLFGTPIINQPQVAILGIGTIEKRPVVLTDPDGDDMLGIRTMSYFALTFDHRLIDGSDADHFMIAIKKTLQEDTWDELRTFL